MSGETKLDEYSVGPDSLSDYEIDDLKKLGCEWVVYWYEHECYEGDGELVAYKDGLLYFKNLGHCSCYGPLDDFALEGGMEVDAFFGGSVTDVECKAEVYKKVAELLGRE